MATMIGTIVMYMLSLHHVRPVEAFQDCTQLLKWRSGMHHCLRGRACSSLPIHAVPDKTQPIPDMERKRKHPIFPGSIPIDNSIDITTCINQTGQTAPTNALLGKPSHCQCRHGYAQAFSLDPIPPTQKFKKAKMDRLNSGLLKLTCPLLVSSLDVLEDDGFMKELNAKMIESGETTNSWKECMDVAHDVHAQTRSKLVGDESADESKSFEMLQSKLGERGAKAFMDSGVAGANPSAKSADVKCLHAWLADYLFRKTDIPGDDHGLVLEHPIGEAIVQALKDRGVDITGTDTCQEVCSGCSSQSSSASSTDNATGASISVQVPIPRNRQRRKRRQL